MVKKSIIAIALMGMLATVSYGQGGDVLGIPGQIKVDGLWPATITITYTPQEICRIKVWIKVGMFIEIEDCANKKIVMSQVNCPQGQTFPCYKGCVTIRVRANFEAQLSLKGFATSTIINNGTGGKDGKKWTYYFRANANDATKSNTWIVTGDGNWNQVDLCVETWDANIYAAGPNTEVLVGEIAILAVPTATPNFCNYCP